MNSDHYLVIGKIRMKLRRTRVKSDRKVFDIRKLKNQNTKRSFCVELNNRFQALGDLGESIEEQWANIRDAYTDTSQAVLGYRNSKRKEWLSDRTWALVEERKEVKQRIHTCREETDREQTSRDYTEVDKRAKASVKKDKKVYIEEQVEKAYKAETASYRGDLSTLHNI